MQNADRASNNKQWLVIEWMGQ